MSSEPRPCCDNYSAVLCRAKSPCGDQADSTHTVKLTSRPRQTRLILVWRKATNEFRPSADERAQGDGLICTLDRHLITLGAFTR